MQTRLFIIVLALFLMNGLSVASPQPGPATSPSQSAQEVERLLRNKDQALLDAIALGDTKTWDAAMAPGFVCVDETGEIIPRQEFLKQLMPLPTGVSGNIKISAYQFELHGGVAIVIHTDDEDENYHGQHLKARYLTTETWQKSGSDWQLLSEHIYSVLHDPPAIALTAAELGVYTGKYAAGDLTYTIRREGDHLVGAREGRPAAQLDAEVRDVFFVKGQPRTRKIFQRDQSGQVVGFSDRREGVDLVWKKIGSASP